MQKFSERKGYTKVSTVTQKEGMSDELRISLWNHAHEILNPAPHPLAKFSDFVGLQFDPDEILQKSDMAVFFEKFWHDYLVKPIDEILTGETKQLSFLKDYIFEREWFEVFDLLECIFMHHGYYDENIIEVNRDLKKFMSAYRFVDGICSEVTDEQELEALEFAIDDDRFKGVSEHLKTALRMLSDRKNSDYRNSIKESISAVESMAREIVRNEKDTLGKALVKLEKDGKIHKSLKDGFSKMYGYTSDEGGIRHAMMDESNVSADDAKFFLLSCTSFINYLKTKM